MFQIVSKFPKIAKHICILYALCFGISTRMNGYPHTIIHETHITISGRQLIVDLSNAPFAKLHLYEYFRIMDRIIIHYQSVVIFLPGISNLYARKRTSVL